LKYLFFLLLIPFLSSCCLTKNWGKAEVGPDANGNWQAFLENKKMKVRYGYGMGQEEPESCIREVYLKNHPDQNLAGPFLDASAHRGVIIKAEVVKNSKREKKIYLEWIPVPSMQKVFPGPAKSEISIYRNKTFLKIRYLDFCFAHTCDIGLDKQHVIDKNWGGITRIYGYNHDSIPQYEDCLYWNKFGIFGCDSLHTKNGIGGNPEKLTYKNHLIMGVYNRKTRLGFGRILPAANVRCIKILWNKGFEIFPQGKNYTGYLYFFDGSEKEVLNLGKRIIRQ
jgi:hypothetical protein